MFPCVKCHKIFYRKEHLKNHLNRKNKCDIAKIETQDKKRFFCKYCVEPPVSFCRKNYLINHINTIHKLELHEEEIKELKDKLKLLETSQSKAVVNNNVSVTVNNSINVQGDLNVTNILVNPFGQENCEHLKKRIAYVKNCISDPFSGFPGMVKLINFNLDVPQNHNISYNQKTKKFGLANGLIHQKFKILPVVKLVINANESRMSNFADTYLEKDEIDKLEDKLTLINNLENNLQHTEIKKMMDLFTDVLITGSKLIQQNKKNKNKKNKNIIYDYNNPDKYEEIKEIELKYKTPDKYEEIKEI